MKHEEDFESIQNITKFYEKLLATPKRIICLIETKLSNESEKDGLGCLKQYIRVLDQSLLKKFPKLVSGSDLVTFTKINVSFTVPVNEFQRRPAVHSGFNAFIVYAPVFFTIYPVNKNMLKGRNKSLRKSC